MKAKTVKRKPAKRAKIKPISQAELSAALIAVAWKLDGIEDDMGSVMGLRESLAVQASHVRRLLAEKETLVARVAQLEASQGSMPAWRP